MEEEVGMLVLRVVLVEVEGVVLELEFFQEQMRSWLPQVAVVEVVVEIKVLVLPEVEEDRMVSLFRDAIKVLQIIQVQEMVRKVVIEEMQTVQVAEAAEAE
jgi:hypothetical protein